MKLNLKIWSSYVNSNDALFIFFSQNLSYVAVIFQFHISVCNFLSTKSPVYLNSLLSKFFGYITWFVISPD